MGLKGKARISDHKDGEYLEKYLMRRFMFLAKIEGKLRGTRFISCLSNKKLNKIHETTISKTWHMRQ